jgi:hypothetical protein
MSKTGFDLWALYDRVRHYKASWDVRPRNYLSVWKLPVDPNLPPGQELFQYRVSDAGTSEALEPSKEGLCRSLKL